MITFPKDDPANQHWMSLYFSALYMLRGLPKDNGMYFAVKHFVDETESIHNDAVTFKVREIRPYLAAIVLKGLKETQGDSFYFQGIRYGYYLLHLGLRYHQEGDLQSVLKMVTLAHTNSLHLNLVIYRDVLMYIRDDITKNRYASTDALRNDILTYFDRIRRSSIDTNKKQQTLLACCQTLHVFH